MKSRIFPVSVLFSVLAFSSGCSSDDGEKGGEGGAGGAGGAKSGDGEIGAPCERDEHCESGLICDIHGGRGSCQEEHDH